jgi:hypothetical protein
VKWKRRAATTDQPWSGRPQQVFRVLKRVAAAHKSKITMSNAGRLLEWCKVCRH